MLMKMEISSLIKSIKVDLRARDHEAVLEQLFSELPDGSVLKTVCSINAHESFEGALSETGGAIFHCLADEAKSTVIALGVTKKAVARRGGKGSTRVFFVIVSPMKESGTHMQLLSRLEALLLDRAFTHAVLAASTPEEVARALKRAEGSSKSLFLPLTKESVLSELATSDKGLSSQEAAKRLEQTGPNSIKKVKGPGLIDRAREKPLFKPLRRPPLGRRGHGIHRRHA